MSEIWRIDNLQKTVTTVSQGGTFTTGNGESSSSISVTFDGTYYWLSYGGIGEVARLRSDSTVIQWLDISYNTLFFDELAGNTGIWAWLRTNATKIDSATPYVLHGQRWQIKDTAPVDKGEIGVWYSLFYNGASFRYIGIELRPEDNGAKDVLVYQWGRDSISIVATADYSATDKTYQFSNFSDRTLIFPYEPKGKLLEWLQKNADLIDTGLEVEYQDLHTSDVELNTQFKQHMTDGEYQKALDTITDDQLDAKTMTANTINYVTNRITAVQNINDYSFKKDKIQVTSKLSNPRLDEVYFDPSASSEYVEIWTIKEDIPISSSAADIAKLNLNTFPISARAYYNSDSGDKLWLDIGAIWCQASTSSIYLIYLVNDVGSFYVAEWNSSTGGYLRWNDDGSCRTILFNEAPTGNLLTWLQNNAVRRLL